MVAANRRDLGRVVASMTASTSVGRQREQVLSSSSGPRLHPSKATPQFVLRGQNSRGSRGFKPYHGFTCEGSRLHHEGCSENARAA